MENINPLISIITTVKNGEKHLEECFESLQNQSYKHFEHIVIDGGSTDRTLEIINNHKSKIKFFSSQKMKEYMMDSTKVWSRHQGNI